MPSSAGVEQAAISFSLPVISTEQMRQENLAKSAKLQEIGWREYLEQKG